jgi:two-component system chemotaxis response regulator CheY
MARIIVADDDAEIRTMVRHMLQLESHEVIEARDGNMAIRFHKEKPADVIIMDLLMQGKGGIEAIVELKQEDPKIKIIAISGGGHSAPAQYLDLAESVGAMHTLAKPIDMDELLSLVGELTGTHRPQQPAKRKGWSWKK